MCTCGAAFTLLWMTQGESVSEVKWALLMLCQLLYFTVAFGLILLQDYPELRVALGPAATHADRVGLKISPEDWADAGGYASVMIVSAAQAVGILTLGLKLRRAELPEEPAAEPEEVLTEEAETDRQLKEHMDVSTRRSLLDQSSAGMPWMLF